jgi:hypothetical protein
VSPRSSHRDQTAYGKYKHVCQCNSTNKRTKAKLSRWLTEQTRVIVACLRDRRKRLAAIKMFTASLNMCTSMRQKRVHRTIVCFNSGNVCFTAVSYFGSLWRTGSVCARWLWYERERARVGNLLVCYVFCVRKNHGKNVSLAPRRPPVALSLDLVVICEWGNGQGGSALCASM